MEEDMENSDEKICIILEMYKLTEAERQSDTNIKLAKHGKAEDFLSLISWEFVEKEPLTSKYRKQHVIIKKWFLFYLELFISTKILELSNDDDNIGWIKEDGLFTLKILIGVIEPQLIFDPKKWLRRFTGDK